MRFKYKYFDDKGMICSESMKANSQDEILNYLDENNFKLIKFVGKFEYLLVTEKIKFNQISEFSRSLYFLLSAGIDINRAFFIINKQTTDKKISVVALTVNSKISQGYSLNEALELFTDFPVFYIQMIKIGEASGKLELVLKNLADYYENKWESNNKLKTMLIYPATLLIGILVVIVISLVFVIPNYVELFTYGGVDLPIPTQILINLSNFIVEKKYFLLVNLLMVIGIIKLLSLNKNIRYFFHYTIIKIKFLGGLVIKEFNFNFAQTMAFLVDSGISVTDGITMLKKVSNNMLIEERINILINRIKKGDSVGAVMEDMKIFEPIIYTMTTIGIESGKLSEVLYGASKSLKKEINNYHKKISKLIEIFVSIIIGVVLCFVVLGIMLPNFKLANLL